jgi:hypothetical protein
MRLNHVTPALMLGALMFLGACKPTNGDYTAAVQAHWPEEQQAMRTQAQFLGSVFQDMAEGQAMADGVRRDLGMPNPTKDNFDPVGAMKSGATELTKTADMTVKAVDQVRCQKHPSLSGDNCELRLTLVAKDGRTTTMPAKYRFDRVDGKLTVVGVVNTP